MRTVANLVFAIAWAGLAFIVLRALVLTFLQDRRIAALTAGAVALAFVLGVGSPFVAHPFGAPPPAPGANAPPAVAAGGTPVADRCRPGTRAAATAARGAIDTVAVGSEPQAAPLPPIEIAPDALLHVVGWVALRGGPAEAACVMVDGAVAETSGTAGLNRPDVAQALGAPSLARAGYSLFVKVPRGTHRLTVGGVSGDRSVQSLAASLAVHVR